MAHELEVLTREGDGTSRHPPLLFVHGASHGAAARTRYRASGSREMSGGLGSAPSLRSSATVVSDLMKFPPV